MSTYGIAGFVDGFIKGSDTKNRWKDRKRDQARQDRLDKMDADMQERRIRVLDQQIAGTDKAVADQAEMEGVLDGAVNATEAAMATGGDTTVSTSGPAATPGATTGLPPPSGLLPLGLPETPDQRAKVAPPGMPSPEELMAQQGSTGPAAGVINAPVVGPSTQAAAPVASRGPGPVGDGTVVPQAAPVAVRAPATAPAPAPAQPPSVDPMTAAGVKRMPDGTLVAPAPSAAMADELYQQGPAGVRYLRSADENRMIMGLPPVQPQGGPEMRRTEDTAAMHRRNADEIIQRGMKEAPRIAPPAAPVPPPPGPMAPTRENAARLAAPPAAAQAVGPLAGKAPASAPPVVQEMADTAAAAMAATTTPAMEATAAAASRGLPETDKKPTEENRKKFAGDFMDHYREVGAPMVYEALIRKGDFTKAEAFREFLDKDATKAGMENWAKAAFAATVGDMDTFATEIMEAYDRLDYFPDGTTIVRDQSGFTRDKDGNITGAKLTFKDEKTGNTFDQVFSDPNDLVKTGITLLAPEEAFEYYFDQQQAAAGNAKGLDEAAATAANDQQKRVDEAAKMIFEGAIGLDGVPTMTYGQALAEAEAQITGSGAAAGMPPIVRRPTDG